MTITEAIYDYNNSQLEAYIEVGSVGGWHEWEIDIEDLAEVLGLSVRTSTHRVDYGDGGEDIITEVFIDGEYAEEFFFTQEELIQATTFLYAQMN
jgi:hypothetical protein